MKTKRKSNIPVTFMVILLIAMIGFKDFGIFVVNYSGNGENFKAGDKVEVVGEKGDNFTITKDGENYRVPKENLIKNEKSSDKVYEATKETLLMGKAGQPLRWIPIGEKVDVIRLENSRGLFKTKDGLEGFLNLSDLKTSTVDSVTLAVSRVDKKLTNKKGKTYQIKPGTQLKVIDFNDGEYTIIDDSDNRFEINEKQIKLRGTKDQVTRGRRTEIEEDDEISDEEEVLDAKVEKSNNEAVNRVVDEAYKQLGRPYVSGDTGRRGFDCSGLTYSVYMKGANVKLPRTSRSQASAGKYVSKSNLEPGDLVFFRTSGRSIGHVGLYIGDNNMIHASTGQRKMIIASINSSYFSSRYVTARRVIE